MCDKFINLHVHSEYSLDCGVFKIYDYVKFIASRRLHVVSLTERFHLYSALLFYNTSLEFGVKPIIGCEVCVEDDIYVYGRCIFLCINVTGYNNLIRLVSRSYLSNVIDNIPIIKRKWLVGLSNDLIVIGLSMFSDIGLYLLDKNISMAKSLFKFWTDLFGDRFYLAITRMNIVNEDLYIQLLLEVFGNTINLVATNEVCFLCKNDYIVYRSKIFLYESEISYNFNLSEYGIKESYLKNHAEMSYIFSDIPEAVFNSIEIAQRCNLVLKDISISIPKLTISNDLSSKNYLRCLSFHSLIKKMDNIKIEDHLFYLERLRSELNVIIFVGFEDYFLVTYDFINWAIKHNIFIGPGRGSGGGSLVAYALSITNIDPIKYDLLFERFLNLDRAARPDFDIDFCIEGRDIVIDYVIEKYGLFNTAQIVTFGSMTIKSVIRDIGRILGYSYGFVDNITRLISDSLGISLRSEMKSNNLLINEYNDSNDIQVVIDFSLRLEGVVRHIGKHAGGIVISPFDLTNCVPLFFNKEECQFITQFDKAELESLGLIKFDFLGLKTLTIIGTIVEYINIYNNFLCESLLDIDRITLCDNATYFLLRHAYTIGIFQLESFGIKGILKRLQPDRFENIVALVALYRPGPLQSGMLDEFINRKLGNKSIDYIYHLLRPILEETYGVIVYQEQVMKIAQRFSGYSLGTADLLRVVMSKKDLLSMHNQSIKFIDGAVNLGVSRYMSEYVFSLIEKFAGYGFNKSHSVGYALLAYNTAWLKANYTIMFLVSLLSSDITSSNKVNLYMDDCKYFGISITLPDINRSFYNFTISDVNTISYGFGAIKNIGESLITDIINDRAKNGYYKSFFDFIDRVDIKKFTKQTVKSLVYAGVFDKIAVSRSYLICMVNIAFGSIEKHLNNKLYICDLFGNDNIETKYNYHYTLNLRELKKEKNLLSNYISYNPNNLYELDYNFIKNLYYGMSVDIIYGFIVKFKFIGSRTNRLVIMRVQESKSLVDITLSYGIYLKNRNILKKDYAVIIGYEIIGRKLIIKFAYDVNSFRNKFALYMDIYIKSRFISKSFFKFLIKYLSRYIYHGSCNIRFLYSCNRNKGYIMCNFKWKVNINTDILRVLYNLKEIGNIDIIYNI